jgi:hypothetical protein
MGKSGLWVLLLVLGAEVALAGEGEEGKNPGNPPPLTAEQREILRNRAILEDLELLENLDKCRLLDLFLEDPDTPSGEPEEEGRKKK